MFGFGPATRIYLAVGATDMRKGFEGLYGLVRDRLRCEPLSGHVFLFCNGRNQEKQCLRLFHLQAKAIPAAESGSNESEMST